MSTHGPLLPIDILCMFWRVNMGINGLIPCPTTGRYIRITSRQCLRDAWYWWWWIHIHSRKGEILYICPESWNIREIVSCCAQAGEPLALQLFWSPTLLIPYHLPCRLVLTQANIQKISYEHSQDSG